MVKISVCLCLLLLIVRPALAQPVKRYQGMVFEKVVVKKNLDYKSGSTSSNEKNSRFDLYMPDGDTLPSRPLIIWMHGGGFKFGSKRAKSIRMWSRSFARRGYVCAAINYRRSKKNTLRDFKALAEGCYNAMQDAETAIAYLRANHHIYRLDTSIIVLGGNSAGGMVALQSAYSDRNELLKMTQGNNITSPAIAGNAKNIAAVINFWGAIFDTTWLQNANVPIASVHGERDRVVPYRNNGSAIFGSYIIHRVSDSLKIPNRLKTYHRFGHELQRHFIPILRGSATKRRWMESGAFAAEFLYQQLFD